MNTYKFADLQVGLEEAFEYIVTEEKMHQFRDLTGDINPLHNEEVFALEHGYSGRVAYGMLTASLFSTMGGVYLPGKYCLIQQIESKFLSPVYIGDILTVKGVIQKLYDSVKRAEIKITILNQQGKKVIKGTLCVGFLE